MTVTTFPASFSLTRADWPTYSVMPPDRLITWEGLLTASRIARGDTPTLDLGRACRLFMAEIPSLASAVWLFFTHIRPSLMGSEHQSFARETWLSRGFLDSPTQLWATLVDLLVYLFGRPTDLALLAALPLGLMACVKRRLDGLLLIACGTGAVALALSFLDLYPLLGHRHCLYLLVVLAPLAGVGLEFLATLRKRRMHLLALLLAVVMAAGIVQLPKLLGRNWRNAECYIRM